MGPYGSVGAHIKTGRSPMAQDHFQTPPDPQKGLYNPIWVLILDVYEHFLGQEGFENDPEPQGSAQS